MRPSLRDALDKIKYDFEACPLAVYVDDRFIPPVDVQNLLKGALVEVQFELRHFSIAKKKEDSYNATVKQVLVLQPGRERPPNAFKRRNLFNGPVRLNPTLVSAKEADKSGSPFAKNCSLSSQGLAASGSSPGPSGNKNVTLCAEDCDVPNGDFFSAHVTSGSSAGPSGTGSVTVRAGDHVVSGSDNSLANADSGSGSSHDSGENSVHASDEHNEIETGLSTCLLLVGD